MGQRGGHLGAAGFVLYWCLAISQTLPDLKSDRSADPKYGTSYFCGDQSVDGGVAALQCGTGHQRVCSTYRDSTCYARVARRSRDPWSNLLTRGGIGGSSCNVETLRKC